MTTLEIVLSVLVVLLGTGLGGVLWLVSKLADICPFR